MTEQKTKAAAEPPLDCNVRPEILLDLSRTVAAMDAMLSGLAKEYLTCLVQGRLDKWAAAGHAMIDLLACDEKLPRGKRADIGPNYK